MNEYDTENRLSKAVITMPEPLPGDVTEPESGAATGQASEPTSGQELETGGDTAENGNRVKKITQENLYNGNGQLISKSKGAKETHYFYQDGVVLYTVEGKSELSYEYADFGETEVNGNSVFQNENCYTGGIYDGATGLYYLNAWYYDPENGRFLTEDTYRGELNEPDTLHLYAYCKNNPINYVDPSGHFVFSVGVEISYAFLLGYYKTVAIAIDGKGDSKILMTVGGIVNTAFGSASCSIVGCLYVNYNSVQKVTSGISSSIGGVVSVGKKYSLSAGVDVSGKSRSLVISGSAGVATSVKRKYIECKLGGKVTSKKYNLNNMLKKDKIGKKYSTKLKGKTITIKKASKTYLEVSCKSFPQEV